ncbi:MAG: acetylesterase [Lachnospiraceae bacterium]|nr:acetylesterase [Lachnospiraceae bacterium]
MALLQVNYLSGVLFRTVTMNVILPADKIDGMTGRYVNGERKYKTLYLLHGLLGNYTDWVCGTRIQRWAEERNLAVVMPSGDNSFYIKGRMPFDEYAEFIGKELPEVCRRMFPLSEKRKDTYIAGLSMGGYGAIRNGIVYSDTFSHIAGLSAAIHLFDKDMDRGFEDGLYDDPAKAAKTDLNPNVALEELLKDGRKLPRFYLSCGRNDDLYGVNVAFRDLLKEKGADVSWDEDDSGHDWDFWDSQIKKVLEWLPLGDVNSGLSSGNVQIREGE